MLKFLITLEMPAEEASFHRACFYVSGSLFSGVPDSCDVSHKTRLGQHRVQTFAHARIVVRAELSARTKTEEKYISERLHKALEKRVNKITRG